MPGGDMVHGDFNTCNLLLNDGAVSAVISRAGCAGGLCCRDRILHRGDSSFRHQPALVMDTIETLRELADDLSVPLDSVHDAPAQ